MLPNTPILLMASSPTYRDMVGNPEWVAEPKLDGWRCLVHVDSEVTLWTKHKKPMANRLGDRLTSALTSVPWGTWLDGETIPGSWELIIWDCPVVDGVTVDWPLERRRQFLDVWLPHIGPVRMVQRLRKHPGMLREAIARGYEGIVLKHQDEPYWAHWYKVKR